MNNTLVVLQKTDTADLFVTICSLIDESQEVKNIDLLKFI